MGRPTKPDSAKAKNAGFTAYPDEITAIKGVAQAKKFKAPFDYVRDLVTKDDHPLARGKIAEPRRVKSQSAKPDPTPAPRNRRLMQV